MEVINIISLGHLALLIKLKSKLTGKVVDIYTF